MPACVLDMVLFHVILCTHMPFVFPEIVIYSIIRSGFSCLLLRVLNFETPSPVNSLMLDVCCYQRFDMPNYRFSIQLANELRELLYFRCLIFQATIFGK